jgi:hypothetical protein
VNNLDQALLMLLVGRREGESVQQLFAAMRTRFDPRLDDAQFGPKYKIDPTYLFRGQRFSMISTFAGSLVIRIVLDTRHVARYHAPGI